MNATLYRIFLASLMQRRLASALSLAAIALGVALGLAVQLIHGAALDEFGRGTRLLAGGADLQVVGGQQGFDEALYPMLALRPEVAEASPLLEVEARLPGQPAGLRIFGVDLFRLAAVQPLLQPLARHDEGAEPDRLAALRPDRLFLSATARARLTGADGVPPARIGVQVGLSLVELTVAGEVPGMAQDLAVMDIAGVQQVFAAQGRLSRIDLKLVAGTRPHEAMQALQPLLPAGVSVRSPDEAQTEAGALSRAYRVNLTMLAAIALLTGGFLVFSTQLLSVSRRQREFALLRALGLERSTLIRGLLLEGAMLGALGGVLGIALGHALAGLALSLVGGDLGAGFFKGLNPQLQFDPGAASVYLLLGIAAGLCGSWLPARAAARVTPAHALHAGYSERSGVLNRAASGPGQARALPVALALAVLCTLLPPYDSIPVGGYLAVLAILAAALLALPGMARLLLPWLDHWRTPVWRLAHARLAATPGQAVVASAGVVASVALAASMAIMVSSFRVSVDDWLTQVLPADLYLRAASASSSAHIDAEALAQIAALPGVASVDTVRALNVRLDDEVPVLSLLARRVSAGWGLPLVAGQLDRAAAAGARPAWISEALADRLQLAPGRRLLLPIAGKQHEFVVLGIWRDYARQHPAVVIERSDYVALSADERINDVSLRLAPGVAVESVIAALRTRWSAQVMDIAQPGEIRALSLQIFDRSFVITYLMEAVAVLIGLFGLATTFAAVTASRRGEFGMLRHLGLTRGDVGRLLAIEGALTAGLGVVAGLGAGAAMAWVLIEIVNRQSFHWSMDLAIPWTSLAVFAASLIALGAWVARLAGAHAMRSSAVLAVKEDW